MPTTPSPTYPYTDPRKIKMFVLDEADEMLSRGFKDQIYDVFRKLPSNTQVILLSATMPDDVLEVTKRFMREPIRILVKKEELTLEGIKQFYVLVEKEVSACVCACVRACVRACVCVLVIEAALFPRPILFCFRNGSWRPCVTYTRH